MAIIGDSRRVQEEVATHLTAHLTQKLREAYALNSARLTAQLFTGTTEAKHAVAAVSSLMTMSMPSRADEAIGVVALGGAAVQLARDHRAAQHSFSVKLGWKSGIAAAERALRGDDEALPALLQEFTTAFTEEVADRHGDSSETMMFLQQERTWIGISGLFKAAAILELQTCEPVPVADVRAKLEEMTKRMVQDKGDIQNLGSAFAMLMVLRHVQGRIIFQREWHNPRTNQKLAATVCTGYVMRKLGYIGGPRHGEERGRLLSKFRRALSEPITRMPPHVVPDLI